MANPGVAIDLDPSAQHGRRHRAYDDLPEAIRVEAVRELGTWATPSGRDRVLGLWRPIAARPPTDAITALTPRLDKLLADRSRQVRRHSVNTVGQLNFREGGALVLKALKDDAQPEAVRVAALGVLQKLGDSNLGEAVALAMRSRQSLLRTEGRRLFATLNPKEAVPVLAAALLGGTVTERQGALVALGKIADPEVDSVLRDWLRRLTKGEVASDMQLELLESAESRSDPEIKSLLEAYRKSFPAADPLAAYRETLHGGNAETGRHIFLERASVYCLRAISSTKGGEVG